LKNDKREKRFALHLFRNSRIVVPSAMKIQLIIVSILLAACTAGKQTASSPGPDTPTMANPSTVTPTNNPSLSLADYLKRLPGVQVEQHGGSGGSTVVLVRGNNTMSDQREPLFIINGVNVGFGYENVEPLVVVSDIVNVQVLKSGQETAAYGMQGSNGVIIIRTKK
jgi:TonB-dependent SusC/RagA subfamily outer membrane receptor